MISLIPHACYLLFFHWFIGLIYFGVEQAASYTLKVMNLLAEKYLPIRTNTDATVHVGPNTDQFPTLLGS